MQTTTDLCVLGSGAVGQIVAYAGRKAGLNVTLIENRAPGGTCPNRGCDAKKPFVNAALMAHRVNQLAAAGGGIAATTIDWKEIAAFEKSFSSRVGGLTAKDLEKAGVDLRDATPTFVDEQTVRAGDDTITAERFVIATGQRPRPLDVPGAELTVNSDEFLLLDDLPQRVTFIGGGYIGMEFACAAALAGREVTVIASGDHVLKGFDVDVVKTLEAGLPDLGPHGVRVIAGGRAGSVTKGDDGLTVHADDEAATALVTADLVVNATGRVASIEGMNLAAAGVEASNRGVVVDAHLRSPGNPRVWAGGDVVDGDRPTLIPTAVEDGRTLKHNLFAAASEDDWQKRADAPPASVAFTTPSVSGVGLTEEDARKQHGDAIQVIAADLSTKKYFRQLGQKHASSKLIFDGDERLLGAHFAGESADEVINMFALALGQHCDGDGLCAATLTYPSVSAALQTAFRKATKRL